MLGSWPGQISCETFLGRETSVVILFSKLTFLFHEENTEVLVTRQNFSFTVCLGKSEFSSFLVAKVLFLVVSWAVKCLAAGASKLITIKKATHWVSGTACCYVT